MSLKKIKIALLIIFVLVNVWAFVIYVNNQKEGPAVSTSAAMDTAERLASKNVHISSEIIQPPEVSMRAVDITGSLTTKEEIANFILGDDCFMKDESVYYKDGDLLSIDGYDFVYTAQRALISGWTPVEVPDAKNAKKLAQQKMRELGLDDEYSSIDEAAPRDGEAVVRASKSIEKKRIANCSLTMYLDGEGVYKVEGRNWLRDKITEGVVVQTRPISEVLIRFANKMDLPPENSLTIVELEVCYWLAGRDLERGTAVVVPALKLIDNKGKAYVLNLQTVEEIY